MNLMKGWPVVSYVFVVVISILSASCSRPALNKAFKGNLPLAESNKVITNYCKSCHIHKNDPPPDHILNQAKRYHQEPHKSAAECRACHYLEKDFWGRVKQKTRFPQS